MSAAPDHDSPEAREWAYLRMQARRARIYKATLTAIMVVWAIVGFVSAALVAGVLGLPASVGRGTVFLLSMLIGVVGAAITSAPVFIYMRPWAYPRAAAAARRQGVSLKE